MDLLNIFQNELQLEETEVKTSQLILGKGDTLVSDNCSNLARTVSNSSFIFRFRFILS